MSFDYNNKPSRTEINNKKRFDRISLKIAKAKTKSNLIILLDIDIQRSSEAGPVTV